MFMRKSAHNIEVERLNNIIEVYREKNEVFNKENSNLKIELDQLKNKNKDLKFCLNEANKSNKDLKRTIDKDRAMAYQIRNICLDKSDIKFTKVNIGELASRI